MCSDFVVVQMTFTASQRFLLRLTNAHRSKTEKKYIDTHKDINIVYNCVFAWRECIRRKRCADCRSEDETETNLPVKRKSVKRKE